MFIVSALTRKSHNVNEAATENDLSYSNLIEHNTDRNLEDMSKRNDLAESKKYLSKKLLTLQFIQIVVKIRQIIFMTTTTRQCDGSE